MEESLQSSVSSALQLMEEENSSVFLAHELILPGQQKYRSLASAESQPEKFKDLSSLPVFLVQNLEDQSSTSFSHI